MKDMGLKAEKDAQQMKHEFDEEYAQRNKNILDGMIEGQPIITGLENIIKLNKEENSRRTFVSRHHSEYDFIALQKIFFNSDMRIPNILGGTNLLVKGLTTPSKLIKKPKIDLKKCKLFALNRKLIEEESEKGKNYRKIFKKNVLETYKLEDFLVFFSGRTYNGAKEKYNEKFIVLPALHQHRNKNLKHYCIPIELNYERVIEDSSFSLQHFIKNAKPTKLITIINKLGINGEKDIKWAEDFVFKKCSQHTSKFNKSRRQ
jgi:hypothetical protein